MASPVKTTVNNYIKENNLLKLSKEEAIQKVKDDTNISENLKDIIIEELEKAFRTIIRKILSWITFGLLK